MADLPTTELVARLQEIVRGEVFADEATLEHYSRDASLFLVRPQVVVAPHDVADVKALVKFVSEAQGQNTNLSLTARAAGTDMTGGPLSESIIVDFSKYFNRVKKVELDTQALVGAGYAVVEPGVYYRDFEQETLKKDLLLPCYTASRELCAVGGMVANNSAGEKTLAYGQTERYVRQLKVVLRDGEEYTFGAITLSQLEAKKQLGTLEGDVYRQTHQLIEENYDLLQQAKPTVTKNSSGYHLWDVLDKQKGLFDLSKLFVGAQGTLGLHTEITFSLVKPKPYSRLVVIFLKDLSILAKLVNKVLAYSPESFESYDDHTFKISLKLFPKIVKRLGGSAFSLAFKFLPEFWALLTGGVPKMVLLAEFTGYTDEEALQQAEKALVGVKNFPVQARVTSTPDEAKKYWVMRRESFNLLRQHVKHVRTAPFIDDMVVKPEVLPEFLPELYKLLDKYPLTYTVAGHVGNGNFHIIPLMDLTKPESKDIIFKLFPEVNKLLMKFGGSNTGEHNDGLLRSVYLPEVYGPKVYALFEQIKKIFDPDNIFNPGKKVGATLDYAKAHLDTTGE